MPRRRAGGTAPSRDPRSTAPADAAAVVPGPIAVLPHGDAVRRGRGGRTRGGVVAPLDEATRGIVWTASSGAGELEAVLDAHPRVGWVQLPWAGVDAFAGRAAAVRRRRPRVDEREGRLRAARRRARAHARPRGPARGPAAGAGRSLGGRRARAQPLRRRRGHRRVRAASRRSSCACCSRSASVPRSCGGATNPVAGAARTVTADGLDDALAGAEVVFVAAALTDASPAVSSAPQSSSGCRAAACS